MNNIEEYQGAELFHGYEADFSIQLLVTKVGDGESLYRGVYPQDTYITIKKDYYAAEYDPLGNEPTRLLKTPWVEGGISVTESENGMTDVTFTLIDPGIPSDDGDVEYPFLYPGICTRVKGIFRLMYVNGFGIPPREYRGFLKEMKPTFSKSSYPRAEYTFQCSGYEMTRTVRTCAYPNLALAPSSGEVKLQQAHISSQPDKFKPSDRSWATKSQSSAEPYLTNKTILTTILKSYDYPVCIRKSIPTVYYCLDNVVDKVKAEKGTEAVLPSIKAEPITDWLLMKDILSKTGSTLLFEPQEVNGKVETTAIIENKSNSKDEIMNQEIQFWFNRADQGKRIPYNPLVGEKSEDGKRLVRRFVMLNEPSVTISGNWQASPVVEEKDITEDQVVKGVDGKETTKKVVVGKKMVLTDVDENGDPILYELDTRKLDSAEAEYTFNKLIKGENFNFEAVKKFFIANTGAPKYPDGGSGYKVYQFHGIEASFETQGNPLAQLNTIYPILGLGKYYSIGVDDPNSKAKIGALQSLVQSEQDRRDKQEAEDKANALAAKNGGTTGPTISKAGNEQTPSGANPGTRKPKVTGLRLKSLTHNIAGGKWTTSYNFGM